VPGAGALPISARAVDGCTALSEMVAHPGNPPGWVHLPNIFREGWA
jgi:hypothetical protein